jgi:hypothetical protein
MKTIIAGSREITDYNIVKAAVKASGFPVSEVVSGAARGVDSLGEEYARRHSIPIKRFPADWNRYGRSAGPKRNKQMAEYGDALIAVWDGQSRGTKTMIDFATERGLAVYIHRV